MIQPLLLLPIAFVQASLIRRLLLASLQFSFSSLVVGRAHCALFVPVLSQEQIRAFVLALTGDRKNRAKRRERGKQQILLPFTKQSREQGFYFQ